MFVGHAAVALAARPLAPRVSLAAALAAAWWIDFVWPVFLLLGVEQVEIRPGDTAFTPLSFVSYPWTHSLLAVFFWSLGFAAVFWKSGRTQALILGGLVLSHWFLDAIVHRPDLPLWPGTSPLIGLGLWNSVPATLIVESVLFAAGIWIYVRAAPARDRIGTWAFWGLIALLVVSYLGAAFGPPPANVQTIVWANFAGGGLTIALAWWADRHRGAA